VTRESPVCKSLNENTIERRSANVLLAKLEEPTSTERANRRSGRDTPSAWTWRNQTYADTNYTLGGRALISRRSIDISTLVGVRDVFNHFTDQPRRFPITTMTTDGESLRRLIRRYPGYGRSAEITTIWANRKNAENSAAARARVRTPLSVRKRDRFEYVASSSTILYTHERTAFSRRLRDIERLRVNPNTGDRMSRQIGYIYILLREIIRAPVSYTRRKHRTLLIYYVYRRWRFPSVNTRRNNNNNNNNNDDDDNNINTSSSSSSRAVGKWRFFRPFFRQ